jgi:APA family basic amino acid/polyamine antiporter
LIANLRHRSTPRLLFAFARDGFLPRALASVHPVHRAPQAAIVVQSTIALALAISGTFEKLAILANVSALALYFGCALASWRLRQLEGAGAAGVAGSSGFSGVIGVVPWLACGVIIWLLTGLTRDEWIAFGACLVLATPLYLLTKKRS